MTSSTRDAAQAYRRNAVLTASPEKLIVLLYDGALRSIEEARGAFQSGRHGKGHEAASRAFGIVSELRAALDREKAPDIARELDRLYVYVQGRLLAANRTREGVPLSEARQVLATLKEGWDAVLRSA